MTLDHRATTATPIRAQSGAMTHDLTITNNDTDDNTAVKLTDITNNVDVETTTVVC